MMDEFGNVKYQEGFPTTPGRYAVRIPRHLKNDSVLAKDLPVLIAWHDEYLDWRAGRWYFCSSSIACKEKDIFWIGPLQRDMPPMTEWQRIKDEKE